MTEIESANKAPAQPLHVPEPVTATERPSSTARLIAALPGDLLQGAVQPRRLRGEQTDQLVAPAADGGLGHVVAAGHVGQALVVTEHGQDNHRDLPGRQDPPPGPDHFQVTSQQTGEVADGARGQR
ncbi:hypothetical protein [Streptomyces sp. NPDC012510]|uniref:hypothetical protein n=1 Tax=Streptomyces sp. NPDC012510 TaxID=3364838 RepID=UPI0036F15775